MHCDTILNTVGVVQENFGISSHNQLPTLFDVKDPLVAAPLDFCNKCSNFQKHRIVPKFEPFIMHDYLNTIGS